MAVSLVIVTIIFSVSVFGFLSWQRIKTDREKMRVELYDRRYAAVMALTNALEKTGKPPIADLAVSPESTLPAKEPGLPADVIVSFKYLFNADVFKDIEKIHGLVIQIDKGVLTAEQKLVATFDRLLEKLDRQMSVH